MTYILAIDPGDATGFAFVKMDIELVGRNKPDGIEIPAFGTAEYPSGIRSIIRMAQAQGVDVVVVEDFILRSKAMTGSKLIASRVIGAITITFPDDKVILQQPSEKSRASNRVLQTVLGDIKLPKSLHVRDALRHAVIYAQKHRAVK